MKNAAVLAGWVAAVSGATLLTSSSVVQTHAQLANQRALVFATHDRRIGQAVLAIVKKYPAHYALVRYVPAAHSADKIRDYGSMPILTVRQVQRDLVGVGLNGGIAVVSGENISDYVTIISTSSEHAIQVTNSVVTDHAFFNSVIYTTTNGNGGTSSTQSDNSTQGTSSTQSDNSTQGDASTQSDNSTQGDTSTQGSSGTSTSSTSSRYSGTAELQEIAAALAGYNASLFQAYYVGSRGTVATFRAVALPRARR